MSQLDDELSLFVFLTALKRMFLQKISKKRKKNMLVTGLVDLTQQQTRRMLLFTSGNFNTGGQKGDSSTYHAEKTLKNNSKPMCQTRCYSN